MQAPASQGAAGWFGEQFHWVLIAYAALYLVYAVPLLGAWRAGSFWSDLAQLRRRLKADRDPQPTTTAEGRKAAHQEELRGVLAELRDAEAEERRAEEAYDLGRLAELRNDVIPQLQKRAAALEQQIQDAHDDPPTSATDRLVSLQVLTGSYGDPMVADAVEQLRSQFPRADAQRFELGLLPSVAAYQERVSAARTMAGIFVLVGLLGTMFRLNGVVGVISTLTDSPEMAPDAFMQRMGDLMSGIGGAFDHSIRGVLLMIAALIVVSLIDSSVQKRISALDAIMAREVVPGLAEIQNRYLPELSLADVVRATGRQLQTLDRTVAGLTTGMKSALSDLATRIQEMLQEFGTVQQHYVTLNSWVAKLEDASTTLARTTGELDRAAVRLGQPIDEMNSTLREHLQAQAALRDTEYLERLLAEVKAAVVQSRRGPEAALQTLTDSARDSLAESAAASRQQTAAALAQSEIIEREMKALRDALHATSNDQVSAALDRLQTTTDRLATRLERSAGAFEDASRQLGAYAAAPTFFFWFTQVLLPRLRGRPTPRTGYGQVMPPEQGAFRPQPGHTGRKGGALQDPVEPSQGNGLNAESRVGTVFVAWCKAAADDVSSLDGFRVVLSEALPGAEVSTLRRNVNSAEISFDNAATQRKSYWQVSIDGHTLLLPRPVNPQHFVELEPVFRGEASPRTLRQVRPARIHGEGSAWRLVAYGEVVAANA